jgi:hypothetical protein
LEGDQDLDTRSLVELGFLAEQSLYPVSMSTGRIQDIRIMDVFLKKYGHYEFLRRRLRSFCEDPQRFRESHFKWSLGPPINNTKQT